MVNAIRPEFRQLVELGSLPSTEVATASPARLIALQRVLERIAKPVSMDEAAALTRLFGPDESFGLAWALVHLIESAPGWPRLDVLPVSDNEWVQLLRDRASRATR